MFKQNVTTKESPPFNFQVLTVSQLIQRKRVDLVLSALSEFASKNKDVNVRWTHFGTGDMEKDLKKRWNAHKLKKIKIKCFFIRLHKDV